MIRMLAVVLVGVFVLVSGAAAAERSAKERYIAGVKGSTDAEKVDRLFDEVVNYELDCVRICGRDTRTSVGLDWLRSERSLYAEVQRAAVRLESLKPPQEVARLHVEWVSVIRKCAERMKRLESSLQPIDNLDVIDAFQKKVASEMGRWCFDRFCDVIPVFEEKGYVFS
jgi:hypothetical protein